MTQNIQMGHETIYLHVCKIHQGLTGPNIHFFYIFRNSLGPFLHEKKSSNFKILPVHVLTFAKNFSTFKIDQNSFYQRETFCVIAYLGLLRRTRKTRLNRVQSSEAARYLMTRKKAQHFFPMGSKWNKDIQKKFPGRIRTWLVVLIALKGFLGNVLG